MGDYTPEQRAIRQWLSKPAPSFYACCCMGPQGDKPFCPCEMKMVEVVDGNYYLIEEHRSVDGVTHTAEFVRAVVEEKS